MDNLININNTRVDNILRYAGDLTYFIHGPLLLTISAIFIILVLILYKKIRRKFPVQVNCWFCNNYTKVPYDLLNSWDCPHCQQYNGFTKDGGYNKIIKEQFNSHLNQNITDVLKSSTNRQNYNLQTNGFCKLCNINQQLKIQQLALFVPLNEKNYFEEIEQYREKLEKAYQLCSNCEKTLQETLEKQKYNILQTRLNDQKQNNLFKKSLNLKKINVNDIFSQSKKVIMSGLQWISITIAAVLFIALLAQIKTELKFVFFKLPDFRVLETFLPLFKILLKIVKDIYSFGKELSFAGFLCCSMLYFIGSQIKTNQINLLVWGLLHILLWTNLMGFQILMSGISLYFNHQTLCEKFIYLSKNPLPKKFSFHQEQKTFSSEDDVLRVQSTPVQKIDNIKFSTNLESESKFSPKSPNFSQQGKKKRDSNKKNEIECLIEEGKKKSQVKVEATNAIPLNLNSSIFSKPFLSSLEMQKNEETVEPMDEVYNDLNGLHLGGNQRKSKKPSNFLFSSHNFSEKKNSSIIKPAKFIKNLSSSWAESSESVSRSSTPSSGYSSQKPEKVEANRCEFPKTVSPLSVNPFTQHTPRGCFEYYDGSNGYYNCFSPGFMPFQQCPGPMGQTTIYTYTRPGSFPFPFSWQGFPLQKYTPSPTSPRFSDSSECENLFQNASKNFENSRKWLKLKTVSYYFSIFLNVITFLVLVFFVSAGIISIDWNIPKLNFFF